MKTMKKMIMLMCVVLLALPVQAAFIPHNADTNGDGVIDLDELLRLIQFYNSAGMHCDDTTEDGYAPGWVCATLAECPPLCQSHDLDYIEVDWKIDLDELLRAIQFYNSLAYYRCTGSEDGFCAGEEPGETVVVGFDWTGWPLGDGGSVEECALEDPQGADCGLRSQGLVPDIRYQYSDVVPVGVVLTQNPAVGATVLVDSEVVLVVSAGPAPIIPDLSGLSPADAEEVLAEMGVWTCEPILTEYSHTVALGLVTRSNPPTGGKPSAYSVCVTLWESLGPEPEGEGEGATEGEGSVEGELEGEGSTEGEGENPCLSGELDPKIVITNLPTSPATYVVGDTLQMRLEVGDCGGPGDFQGYFNTALGKAVDVEIASGHYQMSSGEIVAVGLYQRVDGLLYIESIGEEKFFFSPTFNGPGDFANLSLLLTRETADSEEGAPLFWEVVEWVNGVEVRSGLDTKYLRVLPSL